MAEKAALKGRADLRQLNVYAKLRRSTEQLALRYERYDVTTARSDLSEDAENVKGTSEGVSSGMRSSVGRSGTS